MRLKTDENLGGSTVALLREAGHDVETVLEEKLGGASDDAVFAACQNERRALITLDRDFGQVRRFPPRTSAGIVVLELGGPASLVAIHDRVAAFLSLARSRPVDGELWIVEPGRIRLHLERDRD